MLNKLVLLISQGKTYKQVKQTRDEQTLKQRCRSWQETVCCEFISRNRVLGRGQEISKINDIFGDLDVRGKIDLTNATKRYVLVEDHIWYQFHHQSPIESTLKKIYFGIELCTNKVGKAKFNNVYQLSKRIYLGPTSADNDLAFMMCNQAKVSPGSLVIDPFVGTGGLIIPPASKGAHVFGCDLDMRVLNGYSVGRINKKSPYYSPQKKFQLYTPKINMSFEQYGLAIPNIFRMDSTKLSFKKEEIFDAIITDPPYGLRAMSRSVVSSNGKKEATKQKQGEKCIDIVHQKEQEQQKIQIVAQQKKQENIQQFNEQKKIEDQVQNLKIHQDKVEQDEGAEISQNATATLTPQETLKKQQRRKLQKQNRRLKKANLTQEQKEFKKNIVQRLNRERVDQWDRFDKGKVQTTERENIFEGLIRFARRCLKPQGRLVFLYPVYEEEQYKKVQSLPEHTGFKVIDMSQNKLSKGNSRILVTLEKEKSQ